MNLFILQVLFKKTLTFKQWISLLILTLGCIVKNVGVTRSQNAAHSTKDSYSSLAETILADITLAIFSVNIIYILLQVRFDNENEGYMMFYFHIEHL